MPTWSGILAELNQAAHAPDPQPFDTVRRRYLATLATHTRRNVILYATKWTQPDARISPEIISIVDEDVQGLMEVVHGLDGNIGITGFAGEETRSARLQEIPSLVWMRCRMRFFCLFFAWFSISAAVGQTVTGYFRDGKGTSRDVAAERSISLPSTGVIPHVAIGGAWRTIFTVVNDHQTRQLKTTLSFWRSDGVRLGVTLNDGSRDIIGNVFEITLPPHGSLKLETVNVPRDVVTGWVDVEPESIFGAVFAVFRATLQGRPDYEALVTQEWSINDMLLIPFDNRSGFGTALAIANAWSISPLVFDAEILDANGSLIASHRETLGPNSQAAFQTSERWGSTRNRNGVIRLRVVSGWGISALALLFNPSGSVTTCPALQPRTF